VQRGTTQSVRAVVGRVAQALVQRGNRYLVARRGYVLFKGSRLPPPALRFNGPDQQHDDSYLASSIAEADRVIEVLGCMATDLIVDIGCGQGRLAIGLARRFESLPYLGLDVSGRSIDWCRLHIERRHPSYAFRHIDVVNARYNPQGSPLGNDFRLPVPSGAAHLVYMWGVVTNMEPAHLPAYAREIARMLRPAGKLFLTANVEDDVPEVSINPANYTRFACHGPLHIVRYEKRHFLEMFDRVGLTLTRFDHHAAGNCQSDLYFVKAPVT